MARLAAFISALEVFQIQLRKGYALGDLKVNIGLALTKGNVIFFFRQQIVNE